MLVGGEPGTGKSTLAAGIADSLGWAVLRSDEIRKELAGVDRLDHSHTELDAGLYGEGATIDDVRDAAAPGAACSWSSGNPWSSTRRGPTRDFRSAARRLADATAADLVELRCVVDPETAAQRIADRQRRGDDVSDASPEIARILRARFAPWPSAAPIDTARHDPAVARRGARGGRGPAT